MLKFRFRKQNLRRRSNSCPNLERPDDDKIISEQNVESIEQPYPTQDSERPSNESGSEIEECESVPRKERLKFQRSIRRVKKKEREKQENSEKNLLSMDDYYGRLVLLKEWLLEQGKRDIDKISSPKLKSHFKAFIKLWNKRKLPPKYYRSCCVDAVDASSNPDYVSSPFSTVPQLYKDISKLPSYHRFPPVDEPDTPWKSRFGSPSHFKPRPISDMADSPFSTFGKSADEPEPSESIVSLQLINTANTQAGYTGKPLQVAKSGSSSTSPTKFATISRSMTATGMFKPSAIPLSPKLHPVLSPTCPLTFSFSEKTKNMPNSFSFGSMNSPVEGRQSPAYMCVKDAIRYESPEYSQIGELDRKDMEPIYCSLSPFHQQDKIQDVTAQSRQKKKQGLSRRRSKSMEDIYAVPCRLRAMKQETFASSLSERDGSVAPPVPEKNIDLHIAHSLAKQPSTPVLKDCQKSFSLTFDQFISDGLNQDVVNKSKAAVDISPVHETETLQLPSFQINKSSYPSLLSFTDMRSQDQISGNSERSGFKRRSQDKENFGENCEQWKKIKAADISQPPPILVKPSILTGSLKRTTRTPVPALDDRTIKKDGARLSILQIKQLDSSPTFPRRRIKRRSSNLSTTPGKNLTFGNKTPSFAKSSPRRVSFAKDVNDTEKKSTPRRSAGRKANQDKRRDKDVKRQSQDREDFESFWSSHSPVKERNSPSKEGSPGKMWSPPKWLSPSKQVTKIPHEVSERSFPDKPRLSPFRSKKPAQCEPGSPRSAMQSSQSNETTDGFGLSLSPSKLVSRIKRNLSSSLLQKENETSLNNCVKSDNDDRYSEQKACSVPKSILKNKDHVKSFSHFPPSVSKEENQTFATRQFGRRVLGPPLPSSQKKLTCKNDDCSMKSTSSNSGIMSGLKNLSSNLDRTVSDGMRVTENLFDKLSTNKYVGNFESFYSTPENNEKGGYGKTKSVFDQMSVFNRGVSSSNTDMLFKHISGETTNPQTCQASYGKCCNLENKISSFPLNEQYVQCPARSDVNGKSDEFNVSEPAAPTEVNSGDHTEISTLEDSQLLPSCINTNKKNLDHIEASAFGCNSEFTNKNVQSSPISPCQKDQHICMIGSPDTKSKGMCMSKSQEQTQLPVESDCNWECKLERLESLKASPNIVENDSWITVRRKSSVLKKKVIPDSQTFHSDSITEENIVNDILSSTKKVEQDNSDPCTNDFRSSTVSSEVKANGVESEILLQRRTKPSTIDTVFDSSPCLIIDCTDGKKLQSDVTTLSSTHSISSVQPEKEELDQNTLFHQEFEMKLENKTNEEVESPSQKGALSSAGSGRKVDSDKENNDVKHTYPKPCKPKPKPAIFPKPSMRLTKTNTSSSQQKLCGNNNVNSQPTIKKRNSLARKESVGTPRKSSSFKNNSSMRNSVAQYEKNPFVEQRTVQNLHNPDPPKPPSKEKRRSSLTPNKRRSQSKDTCEGDHPHVISFAQRRKFFQQIEESRGSSTPLGMEGKLTQSTSKLQDRPRPPVRPKPRLSRIVSLHK